MSDYDVIVIGSGIGGLTAALACARKERNVLVLEAAKQFGGFINPFQRKHYWFDTGLHYVGEAGPGQALHRQLERLGVLDRVQFRELDPDGFDRYVFPDYEVRMCKGVDAYRERLTRDFPHEAVGLEKFFAVLGEIQSTLAKAAKISGPRSLLGLLPHLPTLVRYHRATYGEMVDGFVKDARLKAVLSGLGGDIGLPPGKASALLMMAVIGHFIAGAYFPIGGQKALRDAYVDGLRERGATLKRNSPVQKILTEGGRVVGVRTKKGEEYRAPVVISNADAVVTLRDLLGNDKLPRRLRDKVARTQPSLGSICVFIGTDLQPDQHGLDEANIWAYPSYDIDALYRAALEHRIGEDYPFFMTVPTLKDPGGSHAPAGKHTVELISFAPWKPFERWQHTRTMKRGPEYVAFKEKVGHKLIAQAESFLPGLSQHIEVLEIATPLTNHSFVSTPLGSVYGPDHTPEQVGLGRFRTAGPVDGLYMCGASIFGAGIATCVSSGAAAARAALAQPSPIRVWVRRLSEARPRLREANR